MYNGCRSSVAFDQAIWDAVAKLDKERKAATSIRSRLESEERTFSEEKRK
jgi:hypothetical protein